MLKLSWMARAVSAAVSLGALAPLVILWTLTPEPAGAGTHTQLGINACSWRVSGGYDCPTCGFTTAVTLATHGRLSAALVTQPAAALLALAAAMAFWIAGYTAVTGSPAVLGLRRLMRPATGLVIVCVLAAAWGYRLLGR